MIETARLILRPFTPEDAEDMYINWASDPEVTRFLTWPVHAGVEVTRTLLEDWSARYEDGAYFNWAMQWKADGRVIGSISGVRVHESTGEAEIGYCLSRAYWGQGIMPEALRAVVAYLFETAEMNRVCACHDVRNPNSGRVMKKAGMTFEGIFRQAGRNNQGIADMAWYAILREDWNGSVRRKEKKPVTARLARESELERINELRGQVFSLHAAGKPDVFKPEFPPEVAEYIHVIWNDPEQEIVVAEMDGQVCGFAVLHHFSKPETPFMLERDFLDIDEFCVDEACRRQGAATAMIAFIREFARERGFHRLELNMWEFNREALAFYEAAGFATYRRYMEMFL